jgi:hypothetical protein
MVFRCSKGEPHVRFDERRRETEPRSGGLYTLAIRRSKSVRAALRNLRRILGNRVRC